MKQLLIGEELTASRIILGCMRMANLEVKQVEELIDTAVSCGINMFDHADIYGRGKSEEVFRKALDKHPSLREKIILQSKCGIVPATHCFDFSKEHILSSVDGILSRLNTDYLDVLLLHRPDTLMEPDEVAEAFSILLDSGKVRHFGVSNFNNMQIELLKTSVYQPIIINQLQFSAAFTGMIDGGFNVNMKTPQSVNHDGAILEYCRVKDITIQAWSPMQYGFLEGVFVGSEKYPELNKVLNELGEKYDITASAVAICFISRHPANIQTVLGTTTPSRIREIAKGDTIVLTREEWYRIYQAAGNKLP